MQFSIYTSTKTRFQKIFFDWLLNLLIMLFFLGVIYLNAIYVKSEIFIIFTFGVAFLTSIITKITKEPLLGDLDKKLLFEEDKITVDNQEVSLDLIKKIEISNYDCDERLTRYYRRNDFFSLGTSNGTDNWLVITYKNETEEKIFFYQRNLDDMSRMETLLVHYHQVGILPFFSLLNILDIKGHKRIEQFKQKYGLEGA